MQKTRAKIKWAVGLLLCAGMGMSFFASCQKQRTPQGIKQTAFVMNTLFTADFEAERPQAVWDEMLAALTALEDVCSLHKEGSALRRFNASAGQGPVQVEPTLLALVRQGQALSAESGGRFDITVAPLTLLWNVSGGGPVPTDEEIEAARSLVGAKALQISADATAASLSEAGMGIDLGGLAKGAALDGIKRLCEEKAVARGCFSLGGSVYVHGEKGDGTPFKVGLRTPEPDSGAVFASLMLADRFVTTSGAYERFFIQDGQTYHHIIDPQTGYPAVSDIDSVTVVTEEGTMGDYLSTLLFMLGREEAVALMRERALEGVLVSEGVVYVSKALWPVFQLLDTRYEAKEI